jgi:N-acyl-phosphatidylethanolamine-hydrolysing phospholipase D
VRLPVGRFDDRATQPSPGLRHMLKWKVVDALRGRNRRDPGSFRTPVVPVDVAAFQEDVPLLSWVGHSSFLLRLGGALVATDPVWSPRLLGGVRRLVPAALPEPMPRIDVVTVSHNHFDHLDAPTLRRIGPDALFVTPLGNGPLLRALGLSRVVELDWWQSHRHAELEITAVPARHWSMRAPWNRNDMLWSGFVLRGPEGAAYHAGDTALFDGFREIGARLGPIDWAMLPIGAYEPRWFMEPQHMNPDDALDAFAALGARTLVAMHWGTFKLTDEPLGEPPARLRALWEERGLDPSRLWLLAVGETRLLNGR